MNQITQDQTRIRNQRRKTGTSEDDNGKGQR